MAKYFSRKAKTRKPAALAYHRVALMGNVVGSLLAQGCEVDVKADDELATIDYTTPAGSKGQYRLKLGDKISYAAYL